MAIFAGVVACALGAGGIAAALLIPDAGGTVGGNIITAGHLAAVVNHDQGSDISFDDLMPGERRVAYQLVTGDMSGVASADLALTLYGVDATSPFAQQASLTVSASSPAAEGDVTWDGRTCTPQGGFPATPAFSYSPLTGVPASQTGATPHLLGALTPADTAVCVRFEIELPASAGNAVQAKSVGMSLSYSLTQTAAEANP